MSNLSNCPFRSVVAAVFAAVLLFGLAAPSAEAQVLYGSLTGLVTDQSGATIPGAEITATNTQTGQVLTSTSDPSGRYSFVNIQAGSYDVRFAAQGFRTLTQTGVQVNVNIVTRTDIQMELGQVTEDDYGRGGCGHAADGEGRHGRRKSPPAPSRRCLCLGSVTIRA